MEVIKIEIKNFLLCCKKINYPQHKAFVICKFIAEKFLIEGYKEEITPHYHVYKFRGLLHRDGALPAVVKFDGSKEWWKNGKYHRDNDLPAIERFNKTSCEWWKDGKLHRHNGLPAVILSNGLMEWWEDGLKKKDNGVKYEGL